jgi:mannose/cellobiose epimerase-like protein (N-acyl-D-glucosamine 2-epimerase family)
MHPMPATATLPWTGTLGPRFVTRTAHRHWLLSQSRSLFDLFQRSSVNPKGGFHTLADDGSPNPDGLRQLHETCRMIHCFAIGHQMGLPGADRLVDHGMDFLWNGHRDRENGGYFWGVDDSGPVNTLKQAYGHAFVILAASSARMVGHPDADRLLEDVDDILMTRFWDATAGATTEEYTADWQPLGSYRGQNSNMHLTEALMAAYEAFEQARYLTMAEGIATLFIDRHARTEGWRVPEHYGPEWQVDRDYAGDPMFRPSGTTPGHALEWSRLLVQLWTLSGHAKPWLLDAAQGLFAKTTAIGWNAKTGGFYYTLDWSDRPDRADRYWWPCAEGIGAAAVLAAVCPDDPTYEMWYRRIWGFVDAHLIDHRHGGWYAELDENLARVTKVFHGKPDIYHALQACLIPLLPANGSITRGLTGDGAARLLTG